MRTVTIGRKRRSHLPSEVVSESFRLMPFVAKEASCATRVLRTVVVVWVLSLLLFLCGSWILPLLDRDEPRFAEASREMIERGDLIVPHLNGGFRFDKPPLIYWLQVGSMRLLGQSEFAVRLPSVLCASLTAAVAALWAGRMAGAAAGGMAGLLFATCLQVQIHGRIAVADMAMVLFYTVSGWAGFEAASAWSRVSARVAWAVVFFASLALGFLAKGPVAWLPIIPVAWLWARRSAEVSIGSRGNLILTWAVGLLGMLAAVAVWGIPALIATRGQFFAVGIGKHVVARSVGVMEGHGLRGLFGYLATLPTYVLLLVPGFLPWSPMLITRLWRQRPWKHREAEDSYLLGGALLVFIVFTLVHTKLPHYTLPAYPLLCVWLALRLAQEPFPPARFLRVASVWAGFVVLLTTAGFSFAARHFPVPPLVQRCRDFLTSDTQVASVGFGEPSLYWYFRAHTRQFIQHIDPDEAEAFLAGAGPRLCIVSDLRLAEVLTARFPDARREESTGINVANGRQVRLVGFFRGK
jgi:4-amino-4-deoxy-L-arabinose transferase-like glycosyltransferase